MYRRKIYKASGNEIKVGILMSMALFVLFTFICVISESHMMDFERGIFYFVLTFSFTLYLYVMRGHDILFDNVKTMRCCIYACELNWELLELMLGKKEKGKMPGNGFKIWLQGVDANGNMNPIVSRHIQMYEHPTEFELESRDCELYHEIANLRKNHIKNKKDGKKTGEFLYGEITYVEKSKLIVGFKYLGTKKYA